MTNPSSNEGAVSVVSAARLREIAAIRLACAQAMLALASQQPSVLSAIDAAAQGELGQGEAEEILSAHLAARESCIDAMRSFDSEWRQLAADAVQWSASEVDDVQAVSRGFLALLAEIESSDTLFARELLLRAGALPASKSPAPTAPSPPIALTALHAAKSRASPIGGADGIAARRQHRLL